MYRYSCEISYDGGKFFGWQTQPERVTVQESLEQALSLLNGSPVKVTGAGRTDAGVHARGQVTRGAMRCGVNMPFSSGADRSAIRRSSPMCGGRKRTTGTTTRCAAPACC